MNRGDDKQLETKVSRRRRKIEALACEGHRAMTPMRTSEMLNPVSQFRTGWDGPSRHPPAVQIIVLAMALFILFTGLSAPVLAQSLYGTATVIDGDTLDIHGTRIRLHGIDAPESRQTCQDARGTPYHCGVRATQALTRWIDTQTVTCVARDQDRYGRIIATCSVDGADLGAFMVKSGHALAYQRYSHAYIDHEIRAQSAGIGMWQGAFIAPWDWRRGQR